MYLRGNIKTFIIYGLVIGALILSPFPGNAEKISEEMTNEMTLREFIRQVVTKNENILAQYLDFKISKEEIKIEKSVFEPQFLTGYQRGGQKILEKSIFGESELNELTGGFQTTLESKVPTGAVVKLGYNIETTQNLTLDEENQYESFMGVEITQPLLKGSGKAVNAFIKAAEANSDNAFQLYRKKMLEIVLNAAATCWDYYAAREKLAIRKDSVKITEQILKDNKERAKLGKMAKTEILEAQAGLAKRKSIETKAKQDLLTAVNNMRSYISSLEVETKININLNEQINEDAYKPDLNSSMQKAFHFRPEYLSAKIKIEKENILVGYAKNQRWPQLDLKASYGLNGWGDSAENSWDNMAYGDYQTWTVGAVLTIPLFGGKKTKSELSSAIYHKRQALLELKSIEVEIANMAHTAIQNVYSTLEQLKNYTNVRELNQRLLEVELAMLEAGRSNSRVVLDKEEDLIEAKEAALESFIENKKAILVLETTEGVLLRKYDVDVKPVTATN